MAIIRGAVFVDNTAKSISTNSVALVSKIFVSNGITAQDVEGIFFTATNSVTAFNPATAVRNSLDLGNVALMCAAEASCSVAPKPCIRVAVFAPQLLQNGVKHCYLGDAACLRADLKK